MKNFILIIFCILVPLSIQAQSPRLTTDCEKWITEDSQTWLVETVEKSACDLPQLGSLFPNPALDQLQISNNTIALDWQIFDNLGRLITVQTAQILDISTLAQGSYIAKITILNQSVIRKFIKL